MNIFLPGFLGEWEPFSLPATPGFYAGVEALLRHFESKFGPGPYELTGYSMGGRLALAIAVWHPEKVAKLTLISASPGLESERDRQARIDLDLSVAVRLERRPLWVFLQEWYGQSLFDSLRASPNFSMVMSKRMKIDTMFHAKLMRMFSVGNQPSFWEDLGGLVMPVTLVTGELDLKYTQIAQRMLGLNPGFVWGPVPGVGHAVLEECG